MKNTKQVHQYDLQKDDNFKSHIYKKCKKTIEEYEMIKPGDRVAVEITWDCNTLTLLAFFLEYQRDRNYDFAIEFFVETKDGKVDELVKSVINQVGIKNYHKIESNHKEELYQCMKATNCNRMALHQNYNHVVKATFMTYIRKNKKTIISPVVELEKRGISMIRPMFMLKDRYILHWINKVRVNVRLADEITLFGSASILEEGIVDKGINSASEYHFKVYERV